MAPNDEGWTLRTLKVLMDERDRRYGEVAEAKSEAIKVALANAGAAAGTETFGYRIIN